MNCKQCGAPISNTDKFCPNCGAANLEYVKEEGGYSDPFTATNEEFYSKQKPVNDDPFRGNHSRDYRDENYEPRREVHQNYKKVVDEPTCGLGILSFMFPIVGFILYFVFKSSDKLRCAKHAAKWAWVSIILAVVLYAVIFLFAIVSGAGEYY